MSNPNKKLNAYSGPLLPKQIHEGMNAAARNARRLLEDARLLLENKRFPTATSIAILAIEEDGKTSLLRLLALSTSNEDIRDAWRGYRSHTRKNIAWILPQLAQNGIHKFEDLMPLFDEKSDHPLILDQIKQLGFYTDCLEKAYWSLPDNAIDERMARGTFLIAELLVNARKSEFSLKEIELCAEHLGPAWKQDAAQMKKAIINWNRAMQTNGLEPEGENWMQEFLFSSPYPLHQERV